MNKQGLIASIIAAAIQGRAMVVVTVLVLVIAGLIALRDTPIDAIPDLSDVQVIIKTRYSGQAPQVVEDQVTYPLTSAMLSVPGAVNVRGFSFFGDSYVYVIFKDGTDLYWARSRVLEYLSQVSSKLPEGVQPELGPDATGVGWVYQYALADRSGQHDLSDLRSLQDWFLKFELQAVPGVSEVATVGGMVKQYQVTVDPNELRAYDLPLQKIHAAILNANKEAGASVIEMAEAEYMVRASGYLKSVQDLQKIPLGLNQRGVPLLLGDITHISLGPQMRRGIAELNGEGEVVGGIVVMRYGENASQTIAAVKSKLEVLKRSLPDGVELIEVYDRSKLIDRAVDNLFEKLTEEFIVVALICALFLFHFRSSLVVVLSLPVGILCAVLLMYWQGINANIMSLGGIAIAIGAMVDGAIVMIENLHKHIERHNKNYPQENWQQLDQSRRWSIVQAAAQEVGSPLFFSLLIVTVSFLPIFTLEAQEGKMFAPLAYTKTYAMAAAAGLAITLVPVLMGYCIRGNIKAESHNPINRVLVRAFRPVIALSVQWPKAVLASSIVILAVGIWPVTKLGSEFMPTLDEGDWMYMPTTYAAISIGKARQLLQQTDKLIKAVPEVDKVFGKVGRAETATDPAPLTMIETVVQFKPRSQWRPGMTVDKLKRELNEQVKFPGVSNAWVMPIKTRIDMLATGIKTPVGLKISGPDLKEIERLGAELEVLLPQIQGTASVYAERVAGGRYIQVDINRSGAARYGLNIVAIQQLISTAVGGVNVTQTVEGLERFPVNLRYPQRYRDSAEQLKNLPIVTPSGATITLADVAGIRLEDGPPAIKSENARLNGWVLVDIDNRDLGSYVSAAQKLVAEQLSLPPGYSINWSGQYEYMQRAQAKLAQVIPLTLGLIALLLFLNFRHMGEVAIILFSVPLALVGGFWYLYLAEYALSVAVGVGFIALAGVAVEIGVLMLTYLNQALKDLQMRGEYTEQELAETIIDGAAKRVRPILMTAATVVVGLIMVMLGDGAGSEIMRRIAAPMVGGMVSAMLLSLMVIPAVFMLWKRRLMFN